MEDLGSPLKFSKKEIADLPPQISKVSPIEVKFEVGRVETIDDRKNNKVGLRKIRVKPQPFLNPLLGRIVGMWDLMRCPKKSQKGAVGIDYNWVQKAWMEWNVFFGE